MSDLNAGRELDARIATEVMGLKPCDKWTDANMGSAGGPCKVHGTFNKPIPWEPCQCYPVGNPHHYSTDIAAAWEVFEWLAAKTGWCLGRDIQSGWVVDDRPFYDDTTWAETAPLAICLAALKAANA